MSIEAESSAVPPPSERWSWLRPHPFEIATVVSVVVAVAFLRWHGMRMDFRTFDYILGPLAPYAPRGLAWGVGLWAVWELAHRRSPLEYLRRIASWSWLGLWVRLWIASALFTYGYFWLKVTVPLFNPSLFDGALWNVDRWLHLGVSPSVFFVEALAGSWVLPLFDVWYSAWIPSVFYFMAFFTARPDARARRQFMLSCVLLWTLGSWLYSAVPAVGPVYVNHEVWAPVAGQMPRAEGAQAVLWDNYEKMLAGREGQLHQFNPTRGVAALPSLHVAAHWLFALWARRYARALWAPWVAATVLTFVGSIVTGWHYAVDGYVGALLAWGCVVVAERLDPAPTEDSEGEAVAEGGAMVSQPASEAASSTS